MLKKVGEIYKWVSWYDCKGRDFKILWMIGFKN